MVPTTLKRNMRLRCLEFFMNKAVIETNGCVGKQSDWGAVIFLPFYTSITHCWHRCASLYVTPELYFNSYLYFGMP
ncbi:unnamed protein product [Ceratitis capitata]|uniref:(Mediterranean fruit fly) hypothetical protein n=1 Tax=Ceratitis capitata TaxID=7213 RepID=A0A811UAE3_CERCA|nr:unnamed protein product [Ceratitis capitata]